MLAFQESREAFLSYKIQIEVVMILKQERINTLNEPEVVVRYKNVTTEVEQVIAYVKRVNINISCKKDGRKYLLMQMIYIILKVWIRDALYIVRGTSSKRNINYMSWKKDWKVVVLSGLTNPVSLT